MEINNKFEDACVKAGINLDEAILVGMAFVFNRTSMKSLVEDKFTETVRLMCTAKILDVNLVTHEIELSIPLFKKEDSSDYNKFVSKLIKAGVDSSKLRKTKENQEAYYAFSKRFSKDITKDAIKYYTEKGQYALSLSKYLQEILSLEYEAGKQGGGKSTLLQ